MIRALLFDFNGIAIRSLASLVPFATRYGGRVGAGDLTGEADAELLASSGPDPAADAKVRGYTFLGGELVPLSTLVPFPGASFGLEPAGAALGL